MFIAVVALAASSVAAAAATEEAAVTAAAATVWVARGWPHCHWVTYSQSKITIK